MRGEVTSLAFDGASTRLAFATTEGDVIVHDLRANKQLFREQVPGHRGGILVALSADGLRVAAGRPAIDPGEEDVESGKQMLTVWNVASEKPIQVFDSAAAGFKEKESLVAISFDRAGERLAASWTSAVVLLSLAEPGKPVRLAGLRGPVHLTADGRRLVRKVGEPMAWSVEDGSEIADAKERVKLLGLKRTIDGRTGPRDIWFQYRTRSSSLSCCRSGRICLPSARGTTSWPWLRAACWPSGARTTRPRLIRRRRRLHRPRPCRRRAFGRARQLATSPRRRRARPEHRPEALSEPSTYDD